MGATGPGVVPAADLLSELLAATGATNAAAIMWARIRLLKYQLDRPGMVAAHSIEANPDDERVRTARLERLAREARQHWRLFDRSLWYPLQVLSQRADGTSPVEGVRLQLLETGLFVALAECGARAIDLALEDLWTWAWKRAVRHTEGFLRDEMGDARVVPLRAETETVASQGPSVLDDLVMADAAAEQSRRLSALLATAAPRERELLALLHTHPTLTLEQAAARIGVKASTARVWVHRLKRRAAVV